MTTVTISLPDDLVSRVDEAARAEQRDRAEVLREALEHYLRSRDSLPPRDKPSVRRAVQIQDALAARDRAADWDEVTEIRRLRESRG